MKPLCWISSARVPAARSRLLALRGLALLVAVILATSGAAQAQVVETDPAIVTAGEPVTVFFNADEGSGNLDGYDGDVYAYTGVSTAESGDTWICTPPSFDENSEALRMERVSEDRYKLEIDDIISFYQSTGSSCSLGEEDRIESLNFVFRSADADTQTNDLFVEVQSPGGEGVQVAFAQPSDAGRTNPFISQSTIDVDVLAVAQLLDDATLSNVRLLVNGEERASTADDSLAYDLTLEEEGRFEVSAVAEASDGARDTTFFYAVRVAETEQAPLPSGVEDGINDTGSGSVTLVLRAPNKEFVHVTGGFTSDWAVLPAYQMNLANAGTDEARYWLEIDGLTPGTEYDFQYLVDGEIRTGDPYAGKVRTPNDPSIDDETYPNLEPYPAGKTEGIVSVLQPGKDEYEFTASGYERPEQKDLVIYELLVRDFVEKHDYEAVRDSLDYLEDLGVTAIELMPVTEFEGNQSWGYNPSHHLATDKYYGPTEDLKRLIDAAHERDMAVLLDVVYNQATGRSPLAKLYNEGTFGSPTAENPWLNRAARHPFNVFYDVDHEVEPTRYWLDRANRRWLTEFNVDGFRFDLSKGFTQGPANTDPESEPYTDVGNWSSYDAERVATLKRMADVIWETDPEAHVILEHFASTEEEQELANYRRDEGKGMMVWNNLNREYSESALGYAEGGDFDSGLARSYAPNFGLPATGAVTYMESHDEQWLMYRNIAFGATVGDYDVKSFETAFNRQKLVGAFFFTVPGPRMIWQFGELGYGYGEGGDECLRGSESECPASAPGRTAPKPMRFAEYYNDTDRRNLYKAWSALINLRNDNSVFTSPETQVQMDTDDGDVTRSIRLTREDGMNVLVLGNFDTEAVTIEAPFQEGGTWYDFFPGEEMSISNPDTSFAYAPGEFHVYTSAPVQTPEAGIVPFGSTSEPDEDDEPFEPPTEVTFDLNQTFGDASETPNYRLVALPGRSERRVGAGVSGSPGEAWQAYWDTGASSNGEGEGSVPSYLTAYSEDSDRFTYAPGRGFWMIADDARQLSATVEAVALGEENAYEVPLHGGWNIISNPFGKEVPWNSVQTTSGTEQPLWKWYHGSGRFARVDAFASAQAGEAFYFFNDTGRDALTLRYPGAPASSTTAESNAKAERRTLTLSAARGERFLGRVTLGTALEAKDGADPLDQPAPPVPFAAGGLRVAAPEAKGRNGQWAADLRAPGAEGYRYELVLEAEAGQTVTLRASDLSAFADQEVRLVEQASAEAHDLRASGEPVRVTASDGPARLTLLVGSKDFVKQEIESAVPEQAQLRSAYPNPLQAGQRATIEYALPKKAAVTLTLFDALGRRVRTLVDTRQDAGFHKATLRAGDLASGVYFYRLTAEGGGGAFSDSGRLVIVR